VIENAAMAERETCSKETALVTFKKRRNVRSELCKRPRKKLFMTTYCDILIINEYRCAVISHPNSFILLNIFLESLGTSRKMIQKAITNQHLMN